MPDQEITKIQEMIYELLVRDVMTKEVISVTPWTPMSDLREMLRVKRISGTPVLEDGRLVGIISQHDLVRFLNFASDLSPERR